MLGVDEVLRGGRMGYYIGLIRDNRANNAIRANIAYQANRQIELVLYSTLEMLFKSNTFLVRKKILTLSIILIHHDRFY